MKNKENLHSNVYRGHSTYFYWGRWEEPYDVVFLKRDDPSVCATLRVDVRDSALYKSLYGGLWG